MKLLIIGGTRLIGRHLVTAALGRNHEVTLFNRGQHQSSPLANVETVVGDRNRDLGKLRGRSWDAVIDTCGYLPRSVTATAEFLSDSVQRYIFISSSSVYANVSVPDVDETAPVATLTNDQLERANKIDTSGQVSAFTFGEMYGGLKVLCERAAEDAMPDRVLSVRPGLVVGVHDYTDRFTYWVMRVARGGEVMAPGRPDRHIQFIDAYDLAEWIVQMAERQETGVYNANGLPGALMMKSVLDECKNVSGSDASFTWVSDEFLTQENVAMWTEMPLWLPENNADTKGFFSISISKAISSGLRFRPVSDTIGEILTWRKANGLHEALKAGIDPAKEQDLLRKWHSMQKHHNAPRPLPRLVSER